jgi:mannose-6-phosphate isomerase-like protein (cupin superfamily)
MATFTQGERPAPLWFIDNLVHVHVDASTGDGRLAVIEERGRRGNMPPLHVHHRDDETFYVLDGELSVFVGDRQVLLSAGQAMLAPRGRPHSRRVETEEARWLVITAPPGFESFVREVSAPAPVDALPEHERALDPAVLAAAAAEAGIEILGPPGALPCAHEMPWD